MSKGLVTLAQMPTSCKVCPFFETILDKPIVVNMPYGDPEYVIGACRCSIDKKGRRLTPVAPDSDDILEIVPTKAEWEEYIKEWDETIKRTSVKYNTITHRGRPNWCLIRERK